MVGCPVLYTACQLAVVPGFGAVLYSALPTAHLPHPPQTFYDLGLANVVRNRLFVDPEFCAARGKERNYDDPGSLYGAKEAQRININTRNRLYNPGIGGLH